MIPRSAPTPALCIVTGMSDPERGFDAPLYRLLAWFSPTFPIGAFSYSHGLETAAESGKVQDRQSLQGWIAAVLAHGAGRIDADILRDAHRAALAADIDALDAANRRGIAFRATAEMALETTAQGEAFLATCRAAWPDPFLDRWAAMLGDGNEKACHAAAVGAATARAGIPTRLRADRVPASDGCQSGIAPACVSASSARPTGSASLPRWSRSSAWRWRSALTRDQAAFGSAAFAVDLASMAHETQYTRLFRS